jgi:hypothetical protein|nr:MAG TPA: hypothetical protein [Caudoviricetes sp.]
MIPNLTPIQNQYLEGLYLKSLDTAELSYALAVVTEVPKHLEQYIAAMAAAQVLFKLGNFDKDPREDEL